MTNPISNMDLPDEVAMLAYWAYTADDAATDSILPMKAAIRAALQAMCDCGMAKVGELDTGWGSAEGPWAAFAGKSCFILRLDADERKPEEQR